MTNHRHTTRRALLGAPLAISLAAVLLALGSASALAATIVENSETFEDVGSTEATVNAQIDTEGLESTYYFEYGPTTQYGSKTARVSVTARQRSGPGAGTTEQPDVRSRIPLPRRCDQRGRRTGRP